MRLIIEIDDVAHIGFAARAIQWAVRWAVGPGIASQDAIISYEQEDGPDFYIKRNKSSLSIRCLDSKRRRENEHASTD